MESSTYRRIETTGAKANLAKLRALKNDMEGVIKNFETRFLAEFQNNYDSERAQQLQAEIERMKNALKNINTEIGNLEAIGTEYVNNVQNVDETR